MEKLKTKINGKSRLPLLLIAVGVIIIGLASTWQVIRSTTDPISEIAVPDNTGATTTDEIHRVTLKDAKIAYDQGKAIFVDVRSEGSYQIKHIEGAVSLPDDALQARLDELDPDDWIITYCT